MKAFLSALVATVLIAVGVHFAFRALGPEWNAANAAAAPGTVRLDPDVMPAPVAVPTFAPAAPLAGAARDLPPGLEDCARLRARLVFDPPPFAGAGAGAWRCPGPIADGRADH